MADETTPVTPTSDPFASLKEKLENVLPSLQALLIEQAQVGLQYLAQGTGEAVALGTKCLEEANRVGLLLAEGKISKASADLAVQNYLEGMKLAGQSIPTQAASDAYDRGIALVRGVTTILLEVVNVAAGIDIAGIITAFANGIGKVRASS